MDPFNSTLILWALFVVVLLLFLMFPEIREPILKSFFWLLPSRGDYLVEVNLVWIFGEKSTMFQCRRKTKTGAELTAKLVSLILDLHLPLYYVRINSEGEPSIAQYEFQIVSRVKKTKPFSALKSGFVSLKVPSMT